MVDGFINDDFTADGSITADTGVITNQITSGAFDGGNSLIVPGGWISNLGITYSSSTLSVTSADGTALSATNPGYITMQSKGNPGQLTKYTITADQGFIDDTGASEIIGNLFGLPTGVAYTEDIPFYIYAVTNDAEDHIQFMICRVPGYYISPAAGADIGAPDDPVADDEGDFFSFDNIDETLYNQNPCVCIGSFRMRMSAADDWTVQALDFQDGIGRFQEGRLFTFPTGAFGAAAGTHWIDNGGTAPVFTSETYYYTMFLDGSFEIFYRGNTVNNVPAGAVFANLTLPFTPPQRTEMTGWWTDATAGNLLCIFSFQNNNLGNFVQGGTAHLNQDLAANDSISTNGRIQITV